MLWRWRKTNLNVLRPFLLIEEDLFLFEVRVEKFIIINLMIFLNKNDWKCNYTDEYDFTQYYMNINNMLKN